ncbi:MAG: TIGR04283 family arsenosugar biosynthesis glycosyltransferase [Syntrophobacteraceae bacterium]|jgi:hypothetical protein|nr:TIGR04283 family arsenosugar biosynthesis glycosyltransferase [Syntrophobacteraceae bacterium]
MSTLASEGMERDCLSVIIPTLKPASELGLLLASLDSDLWPRDEVIVAQATEGAPEPIEIAGTAHRMRVVFSPRGRGIQLNRGVAASHGRLLLFLHSDSQLSGCFAGSIRRVCADPRVSLGCFSLAFRPSNGTLDAIALWANLRTRLFKMPYGDQGLFCRREVWEKAGGFRKAYLMEDVDFVRECRKIGRIHLLRDRVFTSPRRYVKYGFWRASVMNHLTLLRYFLGEDDRRLYARYYGQEGTPRYEHGGSSG